MAKQRNALKAGIFIVISIVLMFAVAVSIRGLSQLLEPKQQRSVEFSLKDDVGGLRVGDDVRIGGYKVGEVLDIQVVLPDQIHITFSIPRRFELHEGYRVAIQGTVTGQSWLNFESLGDAKLATVTPEMPLRGRPGAMTAVVSGLASIINQFDTQTVPTINATLTEIKTKAVPGITQIVEDVRTKTVPEATQTVASYRTTAETATSVLTEIRSYLKPVIDRYYAVADSTRGMMDEVRAIFGDTKADFRVTMANISSATGTVKDKLPVIMDRIDGVLQKADTAVAGAGEAMVDVKKTVENAREITDAARSVMVSNKGKMDGIIASLKVTGDNLKAASAEVRRSPWRLLYKPEAGEMANLNLYDTARQFADGANNLNDAARALRDALQDRSSDPQHLQQLMEKLDKSFQNFTDVQKKLWEQVKE
jgi:phospholipid/cholesterol/gamma-HCH transport system substrate-binding protein